MEAKCHFGSPLDHLANEAWKNLVAYMVAEFNVEGPLEAGCYRQRAFLMMCLDFEGL
jgi:hypothetical protein